jgi:hypothetical protein
MKAGTSPATPAANTLYQDAFPKAWVRFNGSTATIAASFNVASVSHPSTGRYTITWTTPFASANYAVLCTSMLAGSSIGLCGVESYASGSIHIDTTSITAGNTGGVDQDLITVVAFGAQ